NDISIEARAKKEGLGTYIAAGNGAFGLLYNVTKAPFDDIRARQAVAYALNPDAINKTNYAGLSVPSGSFFQKSSPWYDPAQLTQAKPNAKKAQALLDELAAAGKPLSFTILGGITGYNDATLMQAQLSQFKNITV